MQAMTIQLTFTPDIQEALHYERYHHPVPLVQRRMEVLWLKSHGLVLQRRMNYVQQRCSVAIIWITRRLAAWACLACSLRRWVTCSQAHNSAFVHVRCGSSCRKTRVSCGRVIWGRFFPPVLLKT